MWAAACFYGVEHTPLIRGCGASASPILLWPPTCAHTGRETATKFCLVTKLDVRKNYRADRLLPWPNIRWLECWRTICVRQLTFLLVPRNVLDVKRTRPTSSFPYYYGHAVRSSYRPFSFTAASWLVLDHLSLRGGTASAGAGKRKTRQPRRNMENKIKMGC